MNTEILEKYGVSFNVVETEGGKSAIVKQTKISNISYFLAGYFIQIGPEIFLENIIPEINKAIDGLPYEKEIEGVNVDLEIGSEISYLSSINSLIPKEPIPTIDFRAIVLTWVNWIIENNLEDFIV